MADFAIPKWRPKLRATWKRAQGFASLMNWRHIGI